MIRTFLSRKSSPRRTRRFTSATSLNSPIAAEVLEGRILLSAVNDSVAVATGGTSVAVNVLANDTGDFLSIVSVDTPTNGGMATITGNEIQYALPVMARSLAEFTAANNTAVLAIANWHTTEVGQINAHYNAVFATIGRFGSFLDGWVGGMGTLTEITGAAGGAAGGYADVAAKALGYLASAYTANVSAGNADIILAAQQAAATSQAAEIAAAAAKAQSLTDSLNAQLLNVPNPIHHTNDSFTYTIVEFVLLPMPGTPGVTMPVPAESSATVSVSLDVTDYSEMITNVDNWTAEHSAELSMHSYLSTPDLDEIYANTLLNFASQQGWVVTWQSSTNYWYAAVTDVPFVLDATDIASELNAIGYQP